MIRQLTTIVLLISAGITHAQSLDTYKVEIDLTATSEDQVPVTVYPPVHEDPFVEYHMAKIVPGTYEISDFGRFVVDLTAIGKKGDTLKVEQITTNKWKIESRGQLDRITYKVQDTWDEFDGYDDNVIFEPGGTNINEDDDAYVINTFGFIGYLKDYKFSKYEVKIKHNEKTYGATALLKKEVNTTEDIYYAADFNFLADGPIMYSEPDTITRKIANADILVSVYSPNKLLSAKEVMDNITDLMEAQSKYLGGQLPVDRYAYLIYLNEERTLSGAMGALEHSYSSVYSLPEAGADRIGQTVRDVAAHEFFHIVTPLNIHSEEIGKFDYINPKMSKHLWLYEGVTEYSSMHVQVKYNLYGADQFLDEIREKIMVADRYPKDIPFTEMSENILSSNYADLYSNVYNKGALIGMCLDLYLIKYSNGEKDLQWLLRELSKKYGKDVSFEDDTLFEVIEDLTYPEVGTFLRTYVGGPEHLPLTETLNWAGITYAPELTTKMITLGNLRLNLNSDRQIVIQGLEAANDFAKELKLQEGDILHKINGAEITLSTYQDEVDKFKQSNPGDKVTFTVLRKKKNGKLKAKKLKARAMEIDNNRKFVMEFNNTPTEEQVKVLQSWLIAK